MFKFKALLAVYAILSLVLSVNLLEDDGTALINFQQAQMIDSNPLEVQAAASSNGTQTNGGNVGETIGNVPAKCSKEVNEIQSLEDIRAIQDCKVITGDILVRNYQEPIIQFGGIKNIWGSLIIEDTSQLVRIEAEEVNTIGNTFKLKELTSLSLISFPALRFVKILDWKVLPILNAVHFSNEIKDIESITVSDTSLIGFLGFLTSKLETLDINNNRFLETINCDVEKITGKLHIAANSRDIKASLPKLQSVQNISIHDVAEINLGGLREIESSANFIKNHFDSLSLPNLKSIGGTLSLLKNDKLKDLEFTNVTEIGGGLMVVNNTNIEDIDFFPELSIIGGAIELIGNIKETSFKLLKLVKGSAKIKSFSPEFDCNKWSRSELSSVIRGGKIECTNANNEKIIANTPTDDGEGSTKESFGLKVSSEGVLSFKTNLLVFTMGLFLIKALI